jgi:hypothetical protein
MIFIERMIVPVVMGQAYNGTKKLVWFRNVPVVLEAGSEENL